MTTENIMLIGGPRDGETIEWHGGDLAEFPIFEKMVAGYDFGAKNVPVHLKTALYRRSLRRPSFFVFQP
jgi:hypothetical protein